MILPKKWHTLKFMEWLLIIGLGIAGVEKPPPVIYADRKECVQMAKKIAAENKWLYYLEVGSETLRAEPSVFRPTVYCKPTNWRKSPRGSK